MTSPLEFTSANSELAGAGVYIRNRPWIDDTPVSFYFREIHGRLLRHFAHEKISVSPMPICRILAMPRDARLVVRRV